MAIFNISSDIKFIGINDKNLDLFEGQYKLPNGVSYNSYVILDEKTAILDTSDKRVSNQWFSELEAILKDTSPDYLIASHMEPDHSYNIKLLMEKYKDLKLVCTEKLFNMLPQFFETSFEERCIKVKDGDTLSLGKHELVFYTAPMVHWPEVMVEYEKTEKILFSADAFGKFGSLDADEPWLDEAARYYMNIVGKFGTPVQSLLKKASSLDISKICPLHGPVLEENLSFYLEKYNMWSSYTPEKKGVLIAAASFHGNTLNAAKKLEELLKENGTDVVLMDLSRADISCAVSLAFRFDKLVVAAPSYDGGVFPAVAHFLSILKSKNYQNRKVYFIENYSWAASAIKTMTAILNEMKNIDLCEPQVKINSVFKNDDIEQLKLLTKELCK